MSLADLIKSLVPPYYSQLDQMRAITTIDTSLAIGGAMLLLICYWMVTKSFETKKTIWAALLVLVLLAVSIGFIMQGWLMAGIWMLIIVVVLINFSNMALYGISTSASAAYIIPIALSMFCVGTNAGLGITLLGCIFVFVIPVLQSRGVIKSVSPFSPSHLTFDAPVLVLIYLLVSIILMNWAPSI